MNVCSGVYWAELSKYRVVKITAFFAWSNGALWYFPSRLLKIDPDRIMYKPVASMLVSVVLLHELNHGLELMSKKK